jgi:riboflavin-specific deaminase-like protein
MRSSRTEAVETMDRLPAEPRPDASSDPCAPVRNAPAGQPFVVAQLGQSLDGRIATVTGESRWINRSAGLDHLHRLRSSVDAVVIGIGTAIADDPLLSVRRVEGRSPARVVIDPFGRLPVTARCLADDGVRRLVVCTADRGPLPPGVEAIRIDTKLATLPPPAIVEALFERGLRRVLIEGGARTVSQFIDAGAVDRLHILLAPLIIGSGKVGLELTPIATLSEARRPQTLVHLLADGDVLFDCDLRSERREVGAC